ncbi:uncharacterized protein LOC142240743 [Haematobia irritans]|uniref:uncharacterized protein LOC142240743 n=1 Tax=Haematobia irritans TaxID=7368 RepID=UPI003F4F498F
MFKSFLLFIYFNLLLSNGTTNDYPYCFRFFWIGPYPQKQFIGNETCEERINHENIPCRRPIVTTDNDNVPDTMDLWAKYKDKPDAIGCPMVPGQLCVKYTYLHNKAIQNITYMCAKVNTTTGCYRQKFISGSEIEVCVCESHLGATPCNSITRIDYKFSLLLIAVINLTIFNKLFTNT